MAVLGVDTDKGSLICKNSWGVKIPTVEMYKKKPFYSKNQALWDGGISFSVRLHTMANGEGYVDFECSEASDTESYSESGEVVGQEPLADEMPEGVAYDGKLLENVGDVLVQTKTCVSIMVSLGMCVEMKYTKYSIIAMRSRHMLAVQKM